MSAGSTVAIEKYLDKDFLAVYEGRSLDKDLSIAICQAEIKRYGIRNIRLSQPDVEVRGDNADMTVTAMMAVSSDVVETKGFPVFFRLHWIKRPDGWRISEVTEVRAGLR